MANVNSPFGLKPVRKLDASPYNGELKMYLIPSSDASNRFIGDPLDVAGSANSAVLNGFAIGTLPTAKIATAGSTNRILGVLMGVRRPVNISDDLRLMYRVASTDTIVMVALANNTIFEVQADEDIEIADMGSNANLVAGSGGSTATGFSSWQLDSSSVGTGATLQVHIDRLVLREDNAVGNYAKVEVSINLPRISPDTAGV
jgi:hypothetical protein